MSHEMETGQRKDAQGKIGPGVVHPERHRDVQRQDRAGRAVGPGGVEEPVPVVQVQGRREGREGRRSPGPTTRATSAPTRRRSPDAAGRQARPTSRDARSGWRSARLVGNMARAALAAAGIACAVPLALAQGSAADEIEKYRAGAAGRQPGRAVGSPRRGPLEEAARPEEGLARALRPRQGPGRGQGRVRRDAALLRRRRPRDGPRDAARLVHGHAAGHDRGGRASAIRSAARPQGRHGGARRLRHRRVARREDGGAASTTRRRRKPTRSARRSSFSAAARTTSRARPATARTASASACRTCRTSRRRPARRRATRPGRRIACRRASCASFQWRLYDCFRQQRFPELEYASPASVALTTFLAVQRQRRAVRRAGDQALTETGSMRTRLRDRDSPSRPRSSWPAAPRWRPAPTDAEVRAKALEVMKASFKDRGQAKLDRLEPGRDAGAVQPVRRQGAAEGRRREDREGQPGGDQVPGRRQVPRRLEARRADRAARHAASSSPTTRRARSARNCYACHQLTKAEISDGTIGPSLYHFGKLRGYQRRDAQVRVGQGVERRGVQRVLEHAALRPRDDPHRGADPRRRRAADRSRLAGQPVGARRELA